MPPFPTRLMVALLALAASTAACSSRSEAPACAGPAFALNQGLWMPPAVPGAAKP